jgi:hypothetical protein
MDTVVDPARPPRRLTIVSDDQSQQRGRSGGIRAHRPTAGAPFVTFVQFEGATVHNAGVGDDLADAGAPAMLRARVSQQRHHGCSKRKGKRVHWLDGNFANPREKQLA